MRIVGLAGLIVVVGCTASGRPTSRDSAEHIREAQNRIYRRGTVDDAMTLLPEMLARIPASETPTSVAGIDYLPGGGRGRSAAEVNRLWSLAAIGADPVRLGLMPYHPSFPVPDRIRVAPFAGVVVPEATDGRTCVVVLPDGPGWESRLSFGTGPTWLRSLLAPCLFYARFGRPGAAMGRWLEQTDYRGVRSIDWLLQEHRPAESDYWWWGMTGDGRGKSWSGLAEAATVVTGIDRRIAPYHLGLPYVSCLAGRTVGCDQAIDSDQPGPGLLPAGWVSWRPFGEIGSGGWDRWISDLIRYQGEERFRRFWTSDKPLADSFRAAYNEDLPAAAGRWARHDWEARRGQSAVRLGPTLEPVRLLSVVGWMGLLAVLAAVAASRREATR